MRKWMVLALLGGAVYWLVKEDERRRRQAGLLRSDPSAPPEGDREPSASSDQDLLDEALEESFPASDPPAVSPHR